MGEDYSCHGPELRRVEGLDSGLGGRVLHRRM